MKRLLFAIIAANATLPAFAADVSASIGISQPGFYGRINIGDMPRPQVIYAQPVWIQRAPKVVYVEPVYLRVPPGHEKHWSKHCHDCNACGVPVYFVRHDWYHEHVMVATNESHGQGGHGNGKSKGKGGGKGKGHGA